MKKIAIIGYGVVGKGMHQIFPDALIYDPYQVEKTNEDTFEVSYQPIGMSRSSGYTYKELNNKKEVNECELAIICVPTPPIGMHGEQKVNEDESKFLEVDLSILKDVFSWLKTDLVLIKSTIPPGTVDDLREEFEMDICFSPEYMGMSNYFTPPEYLDPTDARKHPFVTIGGEKEIADKIMDYFKEKLGPTKTYFICTAKEAEAIKYMENTFFAMKVTFVNEWYEICKTLGANFGQVREGWLLDNRINKMHTMVFKDNRGFGGRCFPKDLMGIITKSEKAGYEPTLLKEVWNTNKDIRQLNK